jgi:hypothetical protein
MALDGNDDPTARTEHLDAIGSDDPAPSRRRAGRRALTAVVAALALAAAGALGAALASGSDQLDSVNPSASSTSEEAEPDAGAKPDKEMRIFRGRGHGLGLGHRPGLGPRLGHGLAPGGAPLHGEFVVPDPDGDGYRTVVSQHGEVTSVSDTSLTVRSQDGFSATYRLTEETVYLGGAGGASSLEDGDRVHVAGVRADGAVRAVHVVDLSRLGDRFHHRLRDRV